MCVNYVKSGSEMLWMGFKYLRLGNWFLNYFFKSLYIVLYSILILLDYWYLFVDIFLIKIKFGNKMSI